jgi:uncharacterized membrane protein
MSLEDFKGEIKFTLPPILVISFIFLANPTWFLEKIQNSILKTDNLLIIIGSIPIILALGFLISSLSYFLLNNRHERYPNFDKESKDYLKKNFQSLKNKNFNKTIKAEVIDWVMQSFYHETVQNKVDKRWSMAITNLNCFIALIFTVFILDILMFISKEFIFKYFYPWLILWFIFWIVFYYNYHYARDDVDKMSNFLTQSLSSYVELLKKSK